MNSLMKSYLSTELNTQILNAGDCENVTNDLMV